MRAAVTLLAIIIGLSVIVAVYVRSSSTTDTPENSATTTASTATATAATDQQPAAAQTATPAAPNSAAQPAPSGAAAGDASAAAAAVTPATGAAAPLGQLVPAPAATAQISTIGSDDKDSPYALKVILSAWGASVQNVTLAHYTERAMDDIPYNIQASIPVQQAGQTYHIYPFAAKSIAVNNQLIQLENVAWQLVSPGVYQLDLLQDGQPAVRLTRHYSLRASRDSYEILCKQTIENLTTTPITAVWQQSIQVEPDLDIGSYLGDQRVIYAGYFDPSYDPNRKHVLINGAFEHHPSVLKALSENEPFFWPLPKHPDYELVWFGETNRYFASIVHRPLTDQGSVQTLRELFPSLGARKIESSDSPNKTATPKLMYEVASRPLSIAPGQKENLDLAYFTGPRKSSLFELQPYASLGFKEIIRYELSCAFCTFQWLAKLLLQFLKGIHFILRDWGMAIIVLVLVVRLILHPITKKSQIAMTKMSKQMATLQPELEKIKKKYADDQTKQNQEIMRLYREKGINPAGMLGCLPMFLQTPIWIALYAMLYFAIELRHEPAFYGIFQAISGGKWWFLADLSSADNFLRFSKSFTLNLYFVKPTFNGVNIIPLLMAVCFYLQQALTMPPAANEQQAQQQRIGKMVTLMVPIFLYSAPSGLTLYMLASAIGGMVDGWIVRRHIKKQEEAGTLFAPKPRKEPKPGGLMDRFRKAMEAQQKKIAEAQKQTQQKNKPPRN